MLWDYDEKHFTWPTPAEQKAHPVGSSFKKNYEPQVNVEL